MKRVALIHVDGKLPNLALMQIAAYHTMQGDSVEWFQGDLFRHEYDSVYASKIFSFSEFEPPRDCIIGGTGISWDNRLPDEIASLNPGDGWFLYPTFPAHLGFSETGCRFRCKHCVVPQKNGRPKHNLWIDELLTNPKGKNRLVLLDDDFFGGPNWKENLRQIQERKLKVNFCQGLNIRIITDEQAEMLARTDFYNLHFSKRQVTFAWDRFGDRRLIEQGIERVERAGIKPYQMQFYVLIGFDTTEEQDLERVLYLKDRRCDPFAMPFDKSDPYQKRFARWVNHRAIFQTVDWPDYRGSIKKRTKANLPILFE